MWQNMTTKDVWKMWPSWDPLHGLFYESGLLDNSPMHDKILSALDGNELKKQIIVSAVDANSGLYVPLLLNDLENDE